MDSCWRVKTIGAFIVEDERGKTLIIRTRQAQGALVAILLSPGQSLSRTELSNIFWDYAAKSNRQDNLRQALFQLRQALGPDVLITDRQSCRIAETVRFEIDLIQKQESGILSRGDIDRFMPGFKEPWFQLYRDRLMRHFEASSRTGELLPSLITDSPIAGFVQMLKWYVRTDGAKVIEMMRAHPEFTFGIPSSVLRPLVDQAALEIDQFHPLYGWATFFKGFYKSFTQSSHTGEASLKVALEWAKNNNDPQLEANVLIILCYLAIPRQQFKFAGESARQAARIGKAHHSPSLNRYGLMLAAHVYLHQGNREQCLEILRQLVVSLPSQSIERGDCIALQSLYMAEVGALSSDDENLARLLDFARRTGHHRMILAAELAEAEATLHERRYDVAFQLFSRIQAEAQELGTPHFVVYGMEGVARCQKYMGRDNESEWQYELSRKLRQQLGLSQTAWDRHRTQVLSH